jgi:hypothetical protein
MSLTDTMETGILDHIFRGTAYTPTTQVKLGLSETTYSADSTLTEVSWTAYARQNVAFESAASGQARVNGAVVFPANNSGGTKTIKSYILYDNSGNALAYGDLSADVTVLNTQTIYFSAANAPLVALD